MFSQFQIKSLYKVYKYFEAYSFYNQMKKKETTQYVGIMRYIEKNERVFLTRLVLLVKKKIGPSSVN